MHINSNNRKSSHHWGSYPPKEECEKNLDRKIEKKRNMKNRRLKKKSHKWELSFPIPAMLGLGGRTKVFRDNFVPKSSHLIKMKNLEGLHSIKFQFFFFNLCIYLLWNVLCLLTQRTFAKSTINHLLLMYEKCSTIKQHSSES